MKIILLYVFFVVMHGADYSFLEKQLGKIIEKQDPKKGVIQDSGQAIYIAVKSSIVVRGNIYDIKLQDSESFLIFADDSKDHADKVLAGLVAIDCRINRLVIKNGLESCNLIIVAKDENYSKKINDLFELIKLK